jgi:tRNA A-37 threonylcarbamoyl transferase component Bud32
VRLGHAGCVPPTLRSSDARVEEPTERGAPRSASYRRLATIASGGMGRVDLCVRRSGTFSRLYAVKRLHPHLVDDHTMRAMFLEEARVAGLLRHANVVSVLDLGEDAEGPFLVMDYVDGVSLSRFVRHHAHAGASLPVALCARLVAQIARGLHAAHELVGDAGGPLHLVHRDVSPQNVLVGHDGIVRVTDFGIAKALGRSTHTSTGLLKGKVGYMSPEQLRFEPVDRRSDLFALGVVFYELLTTRRLYRSDDAAEVARMILHDPPPDLGDVRPDLPPPLVELGFRLLAKARDDRPPDAAAVAELLDEAIVDDAPYDLANYVQDRFGAELQARRAEVHAALAALDDVTSTAVRAPQRRRNRIAIAIAAPIAIVGLVSAAHAWRTDAHPSAVEPVAVTDTVLVHLDSRPGGATAYLGDRVLGTTPADLHLPRGAAATVKLELDGFVTTTHEIAAASDERLVIALVPVAAPPSTASPAPAPVEPAPRSSPRRNKRGRTDTTRAAATDPTPREKFRRFD